MDFCVCYYYCFIFSTHAAGRQGRAPTGRLGNEKTYIQSTSILLRGVPT